jgi:uncharacterized repeat protein (TIGR03809 family)
MVKLLLTELFDALIRLCCVRPLPLSPDLISMTDQADLARGRTVVERWCLLAEQRFAYLTELYESGRWRRFHSERDFLDNVQEAKRALEAWRRLLSCEAGPNNRPIDLSWLGSDRPLAPRRPALFADELPVVMPWTFDLPVEPSPPVAPVDSLAAEAVDVDEMESQSWEPPLDLARMHERYPLLRPSL